MIRRAFRLEWLSVGWVAIEAVVAVASGSAARSITLVALGLDCVIELASTGVLIWRLTHELRFGREVSEGAERIAPRIAIGLLLALAAYVVAAASWSLWARRGRRVLLARFGDCAAVDPDHARAGAPQARSGRSARQPCPACRRRGVGGVPGLWLSVVVVAGLVAQLAFGAWWIDAVTSLAIIWFLVKEGRKAWEPEERD